MKNLPTMDDLDTEPNFEELSKAITEVASWKATDSDGIPAELFLQCMSCLLPLLHDILVKCWRESKMLQDMCNAKIITYYKNKGLRSNCINHKGIFLLGIAGNVFARVILPRLQKLAERLYSECNVDLDLNAPPLI